VKHEAELIEKHDKESKKYEEVDLEVA